MKYLHRFFHPQEVQSSLGFLILLGASLFGSHAARAQETALGISPTVNVAAATGASVRADVTALPSAPTPKVEPSASSSLQPGTEIPKRGGRMRSIYWLDRKSLSYGLVQGGAEIFDGVTTRYFIHHCSLCFENDPMSRLLLGTHPSWGKMIPEGIAEAAVSTYSYQRLSHSPQRLLRGLAPLLPMGLTAVHVIEGARNITLQNKYRCADPGYVVVAAVCVMAQSPILTGASGATGGGFGARRNPL